MIRVACVGITVMDRIYYVEGLPTESGKYVARNYTEVGGGPAATAAVAAARLGAQVDFIGRVGDDDTGNSLLAELESWGVNTRYTKRYNQAKSSQSAIMVDATGYQRAGGIKRSCGLFRTGSGALNGRERDGQCAKTGTNAHKWSCLCDPG